MLHNTETLQVKGLFWTTLQLLQFTKPRIHNDDDDDDDNY